MISPSHPLEVERTRRGRVWVFCLSEFEWWLPNLSVSQLHPAVCEQSGWFTLPPRVFGSNSSITRKKYNIISILSVHMWPYWLCCLFSELLSESTLWFRDVRTCLMHKSSANKGYREGCCCKTLKCSMKCEQWPLWEVTKVRRMSEWVFVIYSTQIRNSSKCFAKNVFKWLFFWLL